MITQTEPYRKCCCRGAARFQTTVYITVYCTSVFFILGFTTWRGRGRGRAQNKQNKKIKKFKNHEKKKTL